MCDTSIRQQRILWKSVGWTIQSVLLDIAAWWRIHRVIKAFYMVFALLMIYLRASGQTFGLSVLEEIMPWWSVVFIFAMTVVYLEDGQPVGWYVASLVPMLVYVLAVLYGVVTGTLSLTGLLSVTYLIFGCLGFASGIYGAWRVRQLISTVRELRLSLEHAGIVDREVLSGGAGN